MFRNSLDLLNDRIAEDLALHSSKIVFRHVRGAQALDLLNSKRKSIMFKRNNPHIQKDYTRHILMQLDADIYCEDLEKGAMDLYKNFNLIFRGHPECKNFKRYLTCFESTSSFAGAMTPVVKKVRNVFLGDYLGRSEEVSEVPPRQARYDVSELFTFDHFEAELESLQSTEIFQKLKGEVIRENDRSIIKLAHVEFQIEHAQRQVRQTTAEQREVLMSMLCQWLGLVNGIQRTGKTQLIKQLVTVLLRSSSERTLLVCDSESQLDSLFGKLKHEQCMMEQGHRVLRLGAKDEFIAAEEPTDQSPQTRKHPRPPRQGAPGRTPVNLGAQAPMSKDVRSMDFTLNECVNLCLFHRKVLLGKLQKVLSCLDPKFRTTEYSVDTMEDIFSQQVEPVLDSAEAYLADSKAAMDLFFEMFEKDEEEDNYDYNRRQLDDQQRKDFEARTGQTNIPKVVIEKFYRVKPIVKEMSEDEMSRWEDANRRGEIHERVHLMKRGTVPAKVVLRFLMNYARTVGRRFHPQEVRALTHEHCHEYIRGTPSPGDLE